MKIGDIVYDLLIEEVVNKALYNRIKPKWVRECSGLEQLPQEQIDEKLELIFNLHSRIKGSLNMNMPQVISFLTRYSGLHGREKITLSMLKDITVMPFKLLVEFLEEYDTKFMVDVPCIDREEKDEEEENRLRVKEIFSKNGPNVTLEKINESKKMWEGNQNAVVNDGPLRVYQIMNQEQAIRMGYYYHQVYVKNKILGGPDGYMNPPWCVTARGKGVGVYESYNENGPIGEPVFKFDYDSMYGYYRNSQKRTFYFVIDESKSETNKWYMSALQKLQNGKFLITNMYNSPGEQNIEWDEIVEIYPNIANHKEVLNWREFDEKEIESKSFVDLVNEIPGNRWEFRSLNPQQKKRYIDAGGALSQKSSWESMTQQLRDDYIRMIDGATLQIKIPTSEFLFEILKTNKKYLVARLAIMNPPKQITDLILHFISADFKEIRSNIENENIKLMMNKRGGKKIGIFDLNKNEWFTKDGVKYEPEYKSLEVIDFIDSSNVRYSVDVFSKSTTVDQNSFYSLWLTKDFKDKSSFPAYFMSKKKWDELIQSGKLTPDDTEEEFEYDDNNIGAEVDIKEILKRIKKGG